MSEAEGSLPFQGGLSIRPAHWNQMLEHVLACLPEEACGILGGQAGRVQVVVPVTNQLHSPVRFRMASEEQLRAFQFLEDQGLEMLAFFHSHPAGPSSPSATDLAEFAYPGVLAIIWSPGADGWQARAFQVDDGTICEVPFVIA